MAEKVFLVEENLLFYRCNWRALSRFSRYDFSKAKRKDKNWPKTRGLINQSINQSTSLFECKTNIALREH